MTNKELHIIEKFLDGELSPEEQKEFALLQENSADFAQEVKLQKSLLAHTEANLRAERKERMLKDFRSIQQEEAKVIPLWNKLRYFVAASILIVISVFIFINYSGNPGDEVFASYYRPYDGVSITRSEGNQALEGLQAYYKGDYRTALNELKDAENTTLISESQRLLLIANCYLNLNEPEKSIETLLSINDTEMQLISDNKNWYLALSYLYSDQQKEARALLKKIASSTSVYRTKAEKLLEEEIFM